jgi:predicted DNA-binding transcriptional regulator YafY
MTDTTPTAVEVNCSTGEVTTRELTADEIAANKVAAAQAAKDAEDRAAAEAATTALKASAKAKLVAGQPLTADEASVLVL